MVYNLKWRTHQKTKFCNVSQIKERKTITPMEAGLDRHGLRFVEQRGAMETAGEDAVVLELLIHAPTLLQPCRRCISVVEDRRRLHLLPAGSHPSESWACSGFVSGTHIVYPLLHLRCKQGKCQMNMTELCKWICRPGKAMPHRLAWRLPRGVSDEAHVLPAPPQGT